MIYVYIKNGGIRLKSKNQTTDIDYDLRKYVDFKIDDEIIYEFGEVKKYVDSDQYKQDKNIVGIKKQNEILEKEVKKHKLTSQDLMKDNLRLRSEIDLLRKTAKND